MPRAAFLAWAKAAPRLPIPPIGRVEGKSPGRMMSDPAANALFDGFGLRKDLAEHDEAWSCMAANFDMLVSELDMEDAAKFADQVSWGNVHDLDWIKSQFADPRVAAVVERSPEEAAALPSIPFNGASMGNVAFMALHCADEKMQALCTQQFQALKTQNLAWVAAHSPLDE